MKKNRILLIIIICFFIILTLHIFKTGNSEGKSIDNTNNTLFLKMIDKPLLLKIQNNPSLWKEQIKSSLLNDYKEDRHIVMDFFSDITERQRFVLYLIARVHGSIPTYYPRSCVPTSISKLLFAPQGNCSDYAMRLMLILDLFGIETARISYWTPSLPGHMLVDAYNTQDKTAYILDANYNMALFMPNVSTNRGLLGLLQDMNNEQREKFVNSQLIQMPYVIYNVDNGFSHFLGQNLQISQLNHPPQKLRDMWITSFGSELPAILPGWNISTPTHFVLNLSQLALSMPELNQWDYNYSLPTEEYFLRAGIKYDDLMAQINTTNRSPISYIDPDCSC